MRKLVGVALLAGCAFWWAQEARACSCAGPTPVCSVFWTTPIIFHGRVIERTLIPNIIERKLPDGSTQTLVGNGVYVVRFAVEEMFRGDPTAREITIRTNQQSSACGFPFKDDGDYVVFTYKDQMTSELWTSHCSRTHEVADPAEDADLTWMRGLPTAPATGRIYGAVGLPKDWTGGFAMLKVTGPVNREVMPDSNGRFSLDALPPGDYTVATVPPSGLSASIKPTAVRLTAKGCAELPIPLLYDSHIRGRVTDAAGTPIPGLVVDLMEKEQNGFQRHVNLVITDAGGNYQFSGVPPGDYFVAANSLGPSARTPYPRMYYGQSEELSGAGSVRMEASAAMENVNVTMPLAWQTISIPVRVVAGDGSPMSGVDLRAWAYDESYKGSVTPLPAKLENGTGTVTVYAGRRYWLVATQNEPDGHQRCGGPVRFAASGEVKEQVVVIEHDWGNCLVNLRR